MRQVKTILAPVLVQGHIHGGEGYSDRTFVTGGGGEWGGGVGYGKPTGNRRVNASGRGSGTGINIFGCAKEDTWIDRSNKN